MKNKVVKNFEYRVRTGDTLSQLIHKLYDVSPHDARYAKTKTFSLSLNPQIHNPNLIRAGETLRLSLLSEMTKPLHSHAAPYTQRCMASDKPFSARVHNTNWDNYWALAWLEHNYDYVSMPAAVGLDTFAGIMSEGNKRLVSRIGDKYAEYLAGKITKGQYDYARRTAINELKSNFGPAEKILFGDKSPNEALRIARAGGVPATEKIAKYAEKMDRISKFSKYGGYVLYGVGAAVSCEEIAHTKNVREKNDIAVQTVTSTTIGIVADVAIDFFLFSNPVGWVAALGIAAGVAVASYKTGKEAVKVYNSFGHPYNFVHKLGIDKVCRP